MPKKTSLKKIRKLHNISQEALAKKLSISRSRVGRIENKSWEQLSLAELALFSDGFGMSMSELMNHFDCDGDEIRFNRCSLDKPLYTVASGKGHSFSALFDKPQHCMVGTFRISPKTSMTRDQGVPGEMICYMVLKGGFTVTFAGQEYRISKNEGVLLNGNRHYEIYNASQLSDAEGIFFNYGSRQIG